MSYKSYKIHKEHAFIAGLEQEQAECLYHTMTLLNHELQKYTRGEYHVVYKADHDIDGTYRIVGGFVRRGDRDSRRAASFNHSIADIRCINRDMMMNIGKEIWHNMNHSMIRDSLERSSKGAGIFSPERLHPKRFSSGMDYGDHLRASSFDFNEERRLNDEAVRLRKLKEELIKKHEDDERKKRERILSRDEGSGVPFESFDFLKTTGKEVPINFD